MFPDELLSRRRSFSASVLNVEEATTASLFRELKCWTVTCWVGLNTLAIDLFDRLE